MTSTGLDVYDRTLQTINIRLDEGMTELGPDRQVARHLPGAVLRPLRDRWPLGLSAHLGTQLPLLARDLYYDQWHSTGQPERLRTLDGFLEWVEDGLQDIRSVNVRDATPAVLHTLTGHAGPGHVRQIIDALPEEVRVLWLGSFEANDTAASPARQTSYYGDTP
jgi:uncharacterized protein (DUF2267 family)